MKKHYSAADVLYNVLRFGLVVLIAFSVIGIYADNSDPVTVVIHPDEGYSEPQPASTAQESDIRETEVFDEPAPPSTTAETAASVVHDDGTASAEPVDSSEPAIIPVAVKSEEVSQTYTQTYTRTYIRTTGTDATEKQSDVPQENTDGLININTASAELLTELNGIGEVKATAIVEYRRAHGGFTSVDELINVKGIGEKTLEKIRSSVTV